MRDLMFFGAGIVTGMGMLWFLGEWLFPVPPPAYWRGLADGIRETSSTDFQWARNMKAALRSCADELEAAFKREEQER